MRYVVALCLALVLNATANLLAKVAARGFSAAGTGAGAAGLLLQLRSLGTSGWFWAALVCFGLNFAAYLYALQRLPISLAYPVMVSCGYAIIVAVASMQMGERLVPVQWAGVGLMLAGVWLISLPKA